MAKRLSAAAFTQEKKAGSTTLALEARVRSSLLLKTILQPAAPFRRRPETSQISIAALLVVKQRGGAWRERKVKHWSWSLNHENVAAAPAWSTANRNGGSIRRTAVAGAPVPAADTFR